MEDRYRKYPYTTLIPLNLDRTKEDFPARQCIELTEGVPDEEGELRRAFSSFSLYHWNNGHHWD